jgi:hypothetical protein
MVEYTFVESYLQIVLSVGSEKRQTRLALPLWQKQRTGRLFQKGMSLELM